MIFATDSGAGDSIMRDIYGHATVHEIPLLRSQALGARRARRESEQGTQRLFDPGDPLPPARPYEYLEPWEPPAILDSDVDIEEDPGDDPTWDSPSDESR
jgi:hypothetical protein